MFSRRSLLRGAIAAAVLVAGNGFALASRGFYSVAEIDGVWWFVDPDGKPFYSLGVSDVRPGPSADQYNPKRPAYAAFRHYDSTESWAKHTLERLADWKFNTIGAWADPALTRGPLPYAIALHLGGGDYVPWNDLFSNKFEHEIDALTRRLVAPHRDDRNLLGWFSDNELKWYPDTIFQYHLKKIGSETRGKLLAILIDQYKNDFAALSRDFEVSDAASFDDLARGGELKVRPGGNGREAILRFTAAVAERYYKVVHDAIRRYDPNHLILGDRYPWHCPDVVAKAAAPFVDVISTNLDWPEAGDGFLPGGYLESLHRITGRPILVTEYYVAASENRSGNKNSNGIFLTVGTQKERAAAFENRLRILATRPYVVGAHWFRYADEPPHGRPGDGEDYNFGLVDIQNVPYDDLTSRMRRVQAQAPHLHRASQASNTMAGDLIEIPCIRVADGNLHTQLANLQSLAPLDDSLRLYDLLAAWTPEKLYFAVLACHVSEREGYADNLALKEHELELVITSPVFESPIRVGFGGKITTTCNMPEVECRLLAKGLRYTLVAAIPPSAMGLSRFEAESSLQFCVSLSDAFENRTAMCDRMMLLASGGTRQGELVALPAEVKPDQRQPQSTGAKKSH